MKTRCPWVPPDKEYYIRYHDREWGVPVHDDRTHFEFLILEGAQAGLSWDTILKRREGYRQAFANFDPEKVANFAEKEFEQLRNNQDIIRNSLKIKSAINNARKFLEVQKEFGSFDAYIWRFVDGKTIDNQISGPKDYQAESTESQLLSQDLRKIGFTFVGPTIIYSHMQACGLVNDHTTNCFRYNEIKQTRKGKNENR